MHDRRPWRIPSPQLHKLCCLTLSSPLPVLIAALCLLTSCILFGFLHPWTMGAKAFSFTPMQWANQSGGNRGTVGVVRLQGHLSAGWAFHLISLVGTSHGEERISQGGGMGFFAKQGQLEHVVNSCCSCNAWMGHC